MKMNDLKTITLEKYRFALQQALSDELMIQSIDFSQLYDMVLIEIRGFIWTERTDEEVRKIEYPATWWDAIKVRYYRGWLLAKFPPKMTTISIVVKTSYKAYPNFRHEADTKILRIPFIDENPG